MTVKLQTLTELHQAVQGQPNNQDWDVREALGGLPKRGGLRF